MIATKASPIPLVRQWTRTLVGMAVCVFVIAMSWWWLEHSPSRLPSIEADVFRWINGWPDALRWVLWPIMQLGNVWVCVVGTIAAFALWRRAAPAVTVALATTAAWFLARVVKDAVLRERPGGYLVDVVLRDGSIEGLGFVSGHAAVSFALATALAPWLQRPWRVVAFVLAGAVAVARVYVGAHLPLDVVAGAALGVLCGLGARLAVGVPSDV